MSMEAIEQTMNHSIKTNTEQIYKLTQIILTSGNGEQIKFTNLTINYFKLETLLFQTLLKRNYVLCPRLLEKYRENLIDIFQHLETEVQLGIKTENEYLELVKKLSGQQERITYLCSFRF
jgi:hypothetical protein